MGRPHISYRSYSYHELRYAWHDGSIWHIEIVDTELGLFGGSYTSLALDISGHSHISYYDYSDGDLKYAWHDGSTWHIETVDSAGCVGTYTSLALDVSDHPHISYMDSTNADLKYAWYDGTKWLTETVDSEGAVGRRTSLVLDGSGHPHVGYYDVSNYALKYAWHDGSAWHIETVDSAGNVGDYGISLALDASSRAHIGYQDYTNSDLKYAYWGTGPLAGPVETIPRPNSVEGWGRVDLAHSLFPTDPLTTTFVDQSQGLPTGGADIYTFTVVHTDQALRVTLAWSDYPGSSAAAGGLVNDLDLVVTAPDGSPLYPTNASQRGASQYLTYDDGSYYDAYRWESHSKRGFAVRFTPAAYPAAVDRAQFFLVVSGVSCPYFKVRVLDDDGESGMPGTVLLEKSVAPITDGWFTVDLEGITITDGDFYVELHYVGFSHQNPYLALDSTSPTGRSYVYDGPSWCVLPCAGAPAGNWAIRAVASTLAEETEADRVNNLVGVDVLTPTLGTYTVQVRGYNVPQGPQPYALVVSSRPLPPCYALTEVNITGPVTGTVGLAAAFTATVAPVTATLSITYTWHATGQSPVVHSDGLSDTVGFTWTAPGPQVVTATAVNECSVAVTDTHLITIEVPPPPCYALTEVNIGGPVTGTMGVGAAFTATVAPVTATLPVTYTWQATGQTTLVHSDGLSDTATFTWDITGTQVVTATAVNCGGSGVATHTITIETGKRYIYLPVVLKSY